MTKVLTRWGAVVSLTVLSMSLAFAAPDKDKKAEMPKCPACKMAVVAKKDKEHPAAVKISGKTYYCCGKCTMNKKAATPAKK